MGEFLVENAALAALTAVSGGAAAWFWVRPGSGDAIDPHSAVQALNTSHALIVDVRPRADFDKGHILKSQSILLADVDKKIDSLKKYRDRVVIVACQHGTQAPAAAKKFKDNDFKKVFTIKGGIRAWQDASLPLHRK